MNGITLAILIIILIIVLVILYRLLKPYFLRYDTTLAITGGLGSGKTLTAIKTAVILLRKQRLRVALKNFFKVKLVNFFRKRNNKRKAKYNIKILKYQVVENKNGTTQTYYKKGRKYLKIKVIKPLNKKIEKPMLYSNIPIHFKKHLFSKKREWNKTLKAQHILLLEEMREYSVVVIDELPQFINQFNWNEELIQKNVNEWITFFRHYIGGYLLTTSQAIDDVVVQIRRKLNQATWCYDFRKYFFGLFYTIRMCDIMLSDSITTMSSTYIEDNTRLHFGLFPPKNTYDTRCYRPRYKNIYKPYQAEPRYKSITTTKVLRLQRYISPLDDTTTLEQKKEMYEKGEKIWKN